MEKIHSLLKRQLKRCFGDSTRIPEEWRQFIDVVNAAYREFDTDRETLERSLDLSSQELIQANSEMRAVFQAIPDLLFRLDHHGTILDFKAGFTSDTPVPPREMFGSRIQDVPAPQVSDQFQQAIQRVIAENSTTSLEYALKLRGQEYFFETRLVPILDNQIVAIIRNITERKQAECLRTGQNHILEMIANGAPLPETLDRLMLLIESQSKGMICSVLLLDDDGVRLRLGAAPSLPPAYNQAIDGLGIGPNVGSCGTAAFRKETVIVTDILEDPLWKDYRNLASQHCLRACWSTPIVSHQGKLLGTFAGYYSEAKGPSDREIKLIAIGVQIAGIAIERKRDESELRRTVSVLQSTLESTADGLLVVDLNSQIVTFNKRFGAMWGIPQSLLDARNDAAVLASGTEQMKDPENFRRKVEELYKNTTAESFDLIEFKDGRVFERYSCPQRLDGVPAGRVWSFRDITGHKRSEESLLKLSRVVEQTADAVLITDAMGIIEYVNPAFEALTGFSREEVMGKSPRILKSGNHETSFYVKLWDTILGGKIYFDVLINRKKDGQLYYAETTITPLKDGSGKITHFVSTEKDITESRRLETQLRQSQKLDAFGQLAAGIAHDFNNILTAILGNLSLLKIEGVTESEHNDAVSEATTAAERAANLTRQLLTFSRRQPMQLRDFDLNEVVANITKMLQRLIGEHIALQANFTPGSAIIHADTGMMEQVLINLAVNSRDAMPQGGQLILETAIVTVDQSQVQINTNARPGEFIRLSVRDTGSGIAPEDLPRIFEPFFTTKEVGKGTGLGLATVFGIIEQHHGWIEVESKLDHGTAFHVYLDRVLETGDARTKEPFNYLRQRGNETILLVEDETPIQRIVQRLLERNGYKVLVATTGLRALEIWNTQRDRIDLLITDMVMPGGISGRELSDRLRSEKPRLKVIYCSGYTDEMLGKDSLLRNNPNFLEKPFALTKVLDLVRHNLDSR